MTRGSKQTTRQDLNERIDMLARESEDIEDQGAESRARREGREGEGHKAAFAEELREQTRKGERG
eukprot:729423-Hanusia_phi.AAC.2